MEYAKLTTSWGEVTIKDADAGELPELVDIFKAAFTVHNIFQGPKDTVLKYLQKSQAEAFGAGGYIIARTKDKVVGGVLVRKKEDSEKHSVWNYNHIGLVPAFGGKGVGSSLLKAADQLVKKCMKESAKVETKISVKEFLPFFEKSGFEVEGKLKSHYRKDELVFVLGKEF